MSLGDKLARLSDIISRRDATFVHDFESTLAEISAMRDTSSIVALLEFLEERSPSEEVMFSIVHAIEAHPDDVYVREVLRGTAALLLCTPRWARILYMRI